MSERTTSFALREQLIGLGFDIAKLIKKIIAVSQLQPKEQLQRVEEDDNDDERGFHSRRKRETSIQELIIVVQRNRQYLALNTSGNWISNTSGNQLALNDYDDILKAFALLSDEKTIQANQQQQLEYQEIFSLDDDVGDTENIAPAISAQHEQELSSYIDMHRVSLMKNLDTQLKLTLDRLQPTTH